MKIKSGFVIEKVGGSYLAVAVGERADEFFGLVRMNSTGAFLWHLIENNDLTRDELVEKVLAEYNIDEATVRCDVERFEKQLSEGGILE